MEVENRSPVPFAVAFAIRPYNPQGFAVIGRIESHDRRVVTVDGRAALLFERPPSGAAGSTLANGDVFALVEANDVDDELAAVRCPAGLAQAAFVFAVSHRSTLRVCMPLMQAQGPLMTAARRHSALRRDRTGLARDGAPALEWRQAVPSALDVGRGWQAQSGRGMRVLLPPGRLADAVEANRRRLLLSVGRVMAGNDDALPAARVGQGIHDWSAARVLGALDRWGFHSEVADALFGRPAAAPLERGAPVRPTSSIGGPAAIIALAAHWRLGRDGELSEPNVSDRDLLDRALQDLVRGSAPPRHLRRQVDSPPDLSALLSLRALRDAAELLRCTGEEGEATRCDERAQPMAADLEASLERAADRLRDDVVPDHRRRGQGALGWLACQSLGLVPADHPGLVSIIEAARRWSCEGPALYRGASPSGLSTELTLALAAVELARGDPRALERLRWAVEASTATFSWAACTHPTLGTGCAGDGHDVTAGADLGSLVRNLLVREGEDPDGTPVLHLCSLYPPEWEGHGIEVHEAPTELGRLSYAVRWHGERPALLWQLVPHGGVGTVRLCAPGLDPSWSSVELAGDALLGSWARDRGEALLDGRPGAERLVGAPGPEERGAEGDDGTGPGSFS